MRGQFSLWMKHTSHHQDHIETLNGKTASKSVAKIMGRLQPCKQLPVIHHGLVISFPRGETRIGRESANVIYLTVLHYAI